MMTFQMILIGALVSRAGFMEAGSPALSLFYAIVQPIGSVSSSTENEFVSLTECKL